MSPFRGGALSVAAIPLPFDMLRRADALIAALATEGLKQGLTHASRSLVLKRAIAEGLTVLEAKHSRPSR